MLDRFKVDKMRPAIEEPRGSDVTLHFALQYPDRADKVASGKDERMVGVRFSVGNVARVLNDGVCQSIAYVGESWVERVQMTGPFLIPVFCWRI